MKNFIVNDFLPKLVRDWLHLIFLHDFNNRDELLRKFENIRVEREESDIGFRLFVFENCENENNEGDFYQTALILDAVYKDDCPPVVVVLDLKNNMPYELEITNLGLLDYFETFGIESMEFKSWL